MPFAAQPAKADLLIESLPPERPAVDAGEVASASDVINRSQLLVQGSFHYAGQVATLISGIVLVPLMLHHLGPEVYGFWVLAFSIPGFVLGLDTIVYFPIVREVASHRDFIPETTTRFLSACCGVYLCSGVICALMTLTVGFSVASHLHLSATTRAVIPAVLGAVAVTLVAARLTGFANAVLAGLQMFHVMNSISVAVLIVRTSVYIFLLLHGRSLILIAAWCAAFSVIEATIALGIIRRFRAFQLSRILLEWKRLREIGEFGVVSLLTTLVQNVWAASPPLLVGLLSGNTSANAALYAGQRPCMVISDLNWRGADVIFAASASQVAEKGKKYNSELLDFGSKNVLAIALPLAIGLFLFAPVLVRVWLGPAAQLTVDVMRLTSAGVVADALWVGPLHVLWALGRVRKILLISIGMTFASIVMNLVAIHWLGPVGAALTFSVTAWLGTILTANAVARELGISWHRCLLRPLAEFTIPILLLIGYSLAVLLVLSNPWVVLLSGSAGGALYAIFFVLKQRKDSSVMPGHSSEDVHSLSKERSRRMAHVVRRLLGKIPFLHSLYGFLLVIRQRVVLGSGRSMSRFMNDAFQTPDPWNYAKNVEEQQRFETALRLLQQAKQGSQFGSAFEIGCAEGMFTEKLAPLCKRLVAAEICSSAMERAQNRCAGANVEFMIWDLRSSSMPEEMDLVVVMDVLELFFRRTDLRKAREKLVGAMPPRGFLLLCNSRKSASFESTLWSKWMLWGGKRIAEYFAGDTRVEIIASETSDLCVTTLFRKK